jgi:hypothetical protein
MTRKLPPIGRAARKDRDDRLFILATEDTHAPEQYFRNLNFNQVKVLVLPTTDGESAPAAIVERLCNAYEKTSLNRQLEDEFWLLMDTDHHFQPNHCRGTLQALDRARQKNFGIAISNPCFEVWLLLHHTDLSEPLVPSSAAEALLRSTLGSYNKANLDSTQFIYALVLAAIQRARRLEELKPAEGYIPSNPGTQLYRLLEAILKNL